PGLDALHRDLLERELTLVDQIAAQRAVGMTVLVGVAKPYTFAGFELDLARALDLQEEELDRIRDPCQNGCGVGASAASSNAAVLDLATRVIRHEASAIEAPTQSKGLQLGDHGRQIDHDEIVGHAVDRVDEIPTLRESTLHDGLVVARDEAPVGLLGRHHEIRCELELKEGAHSAFVFGRYIPAALADALPGAHRSQFCAPDEKRAQAGGERDVAPARNIAPCDRL